MGSYEQVVHATTYFSDVEFIEWASKYELIPDIHQIRICNRCAKLMFIHFHANLPDGAVWRCSDYSYSNTGTSLQQLTILRPFQFFLTFSIHSQFFLTFSIHSQFFLTF